jgi:hypothetical protein
MLAEIRLRIQVHVKSAREKRQVDHQLKIKKCEVKSAKVEKCKVNLHSPPAVDIFSRTLKKRGRNKKSARYKKCKVELALTMP